MKHTFSVSLITRIIALSLLLAGSLAFAQSLDEAKAQGLIGEQSDGYIGLVQSDVPQAVVALVTNVNRQRRARYEQIANENGISIVEVAQLAYARAVAATQSGHYIEDANGDWVRKP